MPDLDVLMRAARHECVLDDAEQDLNADLHWMHWVSERLFHFGERRELHKACFNRPHLAWCLAEAGLCPWHETPSSAPRRSEHFVGEEFDARAWLAGVGPEASDARCAFTAWCRRYHYLLPAELMSHS